VPPAAAPAPAPAPAPNQGAAIERNGKLYMPGQWPIGPVARLPQGNNPRTGRPWENTDQGYYDAANYVDQLGTEQHDPAVRAAYHQYAQQLRAAAEPIDYGGAMVNPRTGEILAEKPVHVGGGRLVGPYSGKEFYSGASISDEDARFIAQRMYAGDPAALVGVPKGQAGAKYMEKIYDQLRGVCTAHNETEETCAGRLLKAKIQYAGNIAAERSLSVLESRLGSFAFEAAGAMSLARAVFDRLPRTSVRAINRLIAEGKRQSLDPDQREVDSRVQAVKNAYAATMSRGSNVISDYARKRADELLDPADDAEAARRALDTMESEMRIAVEAPDKMRQFFHDRYGRQSVGAAGDTTGASIFTPGGAAAPATGAPGATRTQNWVRGPDGRLVPQQ
jgi:hypothetical protein